MLRRSLILVALVTALVAAVPHATLAQSSAADKQRRDLAINSCVIVLIFDWNEQQVLGNGSGTIISRDGLILTNNHVVTDEKTGDVSSDGEFPIGVNLKQAGAPPTVRYIAKVVDRSEQWDLALLQIVKNADGTPLKKDTAFPFLPLGDSDKVDIEDNLRVLGFPGLGGDSITFTRGIVAGFENDKELRTMIKTDSEISPGNSGGTAINDSYELIGIPTSIMVNETGKIGHVRPINIAKAAFSGDSNDGSTGTADPANDPDNAGVTVTGKIISADTGKPISGAIIGILKPGVTYDDWDGGKNDIYASAQTDRAGAFTLTAPVAAGQGYTIVLQAKGYQSAWEDDFVLADEKDSTSGSVTWTFKLSQEQ